MGERVYGLKHSFRGDPCPAVNDDNYDDNYKSVLLGHNKPQATHNNGIGINVFIKPPNYNPAERNGGNLNILN